MESLPYNTLEEAPKGEEFIKYAEDLELFEHKEQQSLTEWIEGQNFQPDSETGLFFTFAYIAGGWNEGTPETLIHELNITSLSEAVFAAKSGDLKEFSAYNTRHSHRKVNASHIDRSMESLGSLSVNGTTVSSFKEFFEEVESYDKSERFDIAWRSLEDLDYFGPLTAFDYLEFVIIVNEQPVSPAKVRAKYFDTGTNPPKGFKELFGVSIHHESSTQCLDLLTSHMKDEYGLSMPQLLFKLESCLCMFYKSLEDIEKAVEEDVDRMPNHKNDCFYQANNI